MPEQNNPSSLVRPLLITLVLRALHQLRRRLWTAPSRLRPSTDSHRQRRAVLPSLSRRGSLPARSPALTTSEPTTGASHRQPLSQRGPSQRRRGTGPGLAQGRRHHGTPARHVSPALMARRLEAHSGPGGLTHMKPAPPVTRTRFSNTGGTAGLARPDIVRTLQHRPLAPFPPRLRVRGTGPWVSRAESELLQETH